MYRTVNTLQLMLFHYCFAYEVMKERAEEAEKQAQHLGDMLARVLGDAAALEVAVDQLVKDLDHDEDSGGGEQSPRASDEGSCGGSGD